mmetsp:Transcript_16236/g.28411  ORF Transcript_16236/g.28411 Transcript_16236/m.28411 type:complete len:213 (+) Transcript_16236:900-1538(+)
MVPDLHLTIRRSILPAPEESCGLRGPDVRQFAPGFCLRRWETRIVARSRVGDWCSETGLLPRIRSEHRRCSTVLRCPQKLPLSIIHGMTWSLRYGLMAMRSRWQAVRMAMEVGMRSRQHNQPLSLWMRHVIRGERGVGGVVGIMPLYICVRAIMMPSVIFCPPLSWTVQSGWRIRRCPCTTPSGPQRECDALRKCAAACGCTGPPPCLRPFD